MAKLSERVRSDVESAPWVVDEIKKLENDLEWLKSRFESAPIAIMDTGDVLGICALTEDDFPALYALQGKRVKLVVWNA